MSEREHLPREHMRRRYLSSARLPEEPAGSDPLAPPGFQEPSEQGQVAAGDVAELYQLELRKADVRRRMDSIFDDPNLLLHQTIEQALGLLRTELAAEAIVLFRFEGGRLLADYLSLKNESEAPTIHGHLSALAVELRGVWEPRTLKVGASLAITRPLMPGGRPTGQIVLVGVLAPLSRADQAVFDDIIEYFDTVYAMSSKLKAAEIERERLEATLRRFFSPPLQRAIQEHPTVLEPRTAEATVLMIDLRGAQRLLAEELDKSRAFRTINVYLTHLAKSILEYNGTLDKYIGDEIMGEFGVPFQTAHDFANVAACLVYILKSITWLNNERAQKNEPVLHLKGGAAFGPVTAGFVGSEDTQQSYTVIGEAPNVSNQLKTLADGDDVILISGELNRHILPYVHTRFRMKRELRGVGRVVEIYQVLSPRDSGRSYQRIPHGSFIDREYDNYATLVEEIRSGLEAMQMDLPSSNLEAEKLFFSDHSTRVAILSLATLDKVMELYPLVPNPTQSRRALVQAALTCTRKLMEIRPFVVHHGHAPVDIFISPEKLDFRHCPDVLHYPQASAQYMRHFVRFHAGVVEADVPDIILYHHQYLDGSGYPDGSELDPTRAPFLARILCTCNEYDALVSDRPYRRALSIHDALSLVQGDVNTRHDARVVQALLQAMAPAGAYPAQSGYPL